MEYSLRMIMNEKRLVQIIAAVVFPIGIFIGFYLLSQHGYYIWARFFAYTLFVGLLIFGSTLMSVIGPRKVEYRIEDWEKIENQYHPTNYDTQKWNILLDTHFHTRYSDGLMTIEEGIKWHIAMGFNAFFVTDHNTSANYDEILRLQEKYKDECLVLPGIELAGKFGHLNIIGLQQPWDTNRFPSFDTAEDVKAIVEEAHKQGALVTWNHYPWSYGGKMPRFAYEPPREEVRSWGVDFIEAANWDDDIELIDMKSYEFCMKFQDISPVVGSDVHAPDKDRLCGWTLVKTERFTPESLMDALRTKKTDCILIPGGIPYPTKHHPSLAYRLFRPLYDLGDIFFHFHKGGPIRNIDWNAVISWVLFVLLGFGFIEALIWVLNISNH
jgi:hypothetical protein